MNKTCLTLLLLFAACTDRGATISQPRPVDPPPDTGLLTIPMNGRWAITEVEVLQEAGNATAPLPAEPGCMPPVVGTVLRIENNLAVTADARSLARDATGYAQVDGYVNTVDGRNAAYYRYATTPSVPNVPDGGGAELLQFALGSLTEDSMLGLLQFNISTAFPPADRPAGGLYRITLERVASPTQLLESPIEGQHR